MAVVTILEIALNWSRGRADVATDWVVQAAKFPPKYLVIHDHHAARGRYGDGAGGEREAEVYD